MADSEGRIRLAMSDVPRRPAFGRHSGKEQEGRECGGAGMGKRNPDSYPSDHEKEYYPCPLRKSSDPELEKSPGLSYIRLADHWARDGVSPPAGVTPRPTSF
jgi:hypothetical protein